MITPTKTLFIHEPRNFLTQRPVSTRLLDTDVPKPVLLLRPVGATGSSLITMHAPAKSVTLHSRSTCYVTTARVLQFILTAVTKSSPRCDPLLARALHVLI